MWQIVISIDKKYNKEISYIEDNIERMKGVAYAYYETLSRKHINIATSDKNRIIIEPKIHEIISDVILTYFKYSYMVNNIRFNEENYLNSALISALVYCDRKHENKIINNVLKNMNEFSIDGIYRFSIMELIANWDEVVILVNGLLHSNHTSSDIYSLIQFIMEMSEDRKSVLKISRIDGEVIIRNITDNCIVNMPKISDIDNANLISAIISSNPYEIYTEKEIFNNEILSVVNNITKIKTI